MQDESLPAIKLVVAAGALQWTGAVYPTQASKGTKRQFTSREEFLAAVADLTHWEVGHCDGGD